MKVGLTGKQTSIVKVILSLQTALVILFLFMFFWEEFRDVCPMQIVLFGGGGILTLSGIYLLIIINKWKLEGRIKKYLFAAGLGSAGFLILSILHNLFYAVAVYFHNIIVIKAVADFLSAACFLISLLACPILLIVGIIGSCFVICRKTK